MYCQIFLERGGKMEKEVYIGADGCTVTVITKLKDCDIKRTIERTFSSNSEAEIFRCEVLGINKPTPRETEKVIIDVFNDKQEEPLEFSFDKPKSISFYSDNTNYTKKAEKTGENQNQQVRKPSKWEFWGKVSTGIL